MATPQIEPAPVADAVADAKPEVPANPAVPAQDQAAAASGQLAAAAPVENPEPEIKPQAAPSGATQVEQAKLRDDGLAGIVGQMLVIGFEGTEPDQPGPKALIAEVKSGRIGGVLFAPENVESPAQLKKLGGAILGASTERVPFLVIAHEGGIGQPLTAEKGFSVYPSAGELGASSDPLNAFSVYQNMAAELATYGFNVNLGPVVDLMPPEEKDSIGGDTRHYGTTGKHVAAFAKAFALAHDQQGIVSALKHFPGTGVATAGDQGADAALAPYRELIDGGEVKMVMTSDLADPLSPDAADQPAAFSANSVRKTLREDIGFDGVIVSADLDAAGIAARFPLKDRVVRAIGAGNDILLLGRAGEAGYDVAGEIVAILRDAIAEGVLQRDQLQASYDRVVALKQKLVTGSKALASAQQQRDAAPKAAQQ